MRGEDPLIGVDISQSDRFELLQSSSDELGLYMGLLGVHLFVLFGYSVWSLQGMYIAVGDGERGW